MYTIKALPYKTYLTPENDSLNWKPGREDRAILESHGFTCKCCGLKSRKHRDYPSGYLEVIKIENSKQALCAMCNQSQHLGRPINDKLNHGLIIYCPSLTQGQICKLAQYAFIAKYRENQFAEKANLLIGTISRDLVEPVTKIIPGLSAGDVQEFVDIYEYMSPRLRQQSRELFRDLRYWPNETVFIKQTEFWDCAAYQNLSNDLELTCPENTLAHSAMA